jgi:hypothetical protein
MDTNGSDVVAVVYATEGGYRGRVEHVDSGDRHEAGGESLAWTLRALAAVAEPGE